MQARMSTLPVNPQFFEPPTFVDKATLRRAAAAGAISDGPDDFFAARHGERPMGRMGAQAHALHDRSSGRRWCHIQASWPNC
jgi:hypothetical protein